MLRVSFILPDEQPLTCDAPCACDCLLWFECSLSHGYATPKKKISAVSTYFEVLPYRLNEVRC